MHPMRTTPWFLLICGSLMTLAASPPVIGVAQSRAAFSINNASVPGSATVLDGTAIRTNDAPSDVMLKTGERLRLAPNSAAVVYRDHVVLQAGLAEAIHAAAYRIDAQSLQIRAVDSGAHLTVSLAGKKEVAVSTSGGYAEINNSSGVLVARMYPGDQIQMQPAETDAIRLTGTVQKRGGAYVLQDETTHVTAELRGENLKAMVGKDVRINGTLKPGVSPVSGVSQVVMVTNATVVAAATGTGSVGVPAGAATASGLSTGTTVAVVGGVAAAATMGGLGAAGTFSGSGPAVSR